MFFVLVTRGGTIVPVDDTDDAEEADEESSSSAICASSSRSGCGLGRGRGWGLLAARLIGRSLMLVGDSCDM